MLGPGLGVQGGISAVERMMLAALPADVAATHISTMVEGSKARKLATFLHAVLRTWRAERPDIVHIHFASRASSIRKMSLARLALARGCKLIMHAHGGGYPEYWAALPERARWRVSRLLARADALIVLGERWREFFASVGVPRERIAVLPNPVSLPRSVPQRARRAQAVFAYLGLIAEGKGTFDLIEALARLTPQALARTRLVIAGNGEHGRLRQHILRHGLDAHVEVHGWLAARERDALLASADAFVLPSHREGLPMALLEAMAWGLAPVCTPVGAIPEHVQHERNGLLAGVRDIEALARAIERLALDDGLRARLGAAARQQVEPLALDRYVRRLCELYEAVTWAR
jgi:glycosyltransferase involved in cell wall biosynthesis